MDMPKVYVPMLSRKFDVYGTVLDEGDVYFVAWCSVCKKFEMLNAEDCIPHEDAKPEKEPYLILKPEPAPQPSKTSTLIDNVLKKKVWPTKEDREAKIERFRKRVDEAGKEELKGMNARAVMTMFYDGEEPR